MDESSAQNPQKQTPAVTQLGEFCDFADNLFSEEPQHSLERTLVTWRNKGSLAKLISNTIAGTRPSTAGTLLKQRMQNFYNTHPSLPINNFPPNPHIVSPTDQDFLNFLIAVGHYLQSSDKELFKRNIVEQNAKMPGRAKITSPPTNKSGIRRLWSRSSSEARAPISLNEAIEPSSSSTPGRLSKILSSNISLKPRAPIAPAVVTSTTSEVRVDPMVDSAPSVPAAAAAPFQEAPAFIPTAPPPPPPPTTTGQPGTATVPQPSPTPDAPSTTTQIASSGALTPTPPARSKNPPPPPTQSSSALDTMPAWKRQVLERRSSRQTPTPRPHVSLAALIQQDEAQASDTKDDGAMDKPAEFKSFAELQKQWGGSSLSK
jgi:hypothetical protein